MIHKLFVFAFLSIVASSASAQVTCEPGQAGVVLCPCGNTPSGLGRGCNNSMNTGGASLTATGTASLSADNVQFNCTNIGTMGPSCSSANNSIASLLYEGTGSISTGVVWGDGVLCTSGPYYLLNVQLSNGGIYHWPVPGTTGVSAAAIAAGDPLVSGSTRYYFVAYRDSCPSFCTPAVRQKSNSYKFTWGP